MRGDSYGAYYIKSSSGDVTRNNIFQTDGKLIYFTSAGSNTFYLNDFITTGSDIVSGSVTSEQKWTSDPDIVGYIYNSTEYNNKIVGNYWSFYGGDDLDIDGIIDLPYMVGGSFGADFAPLKQSISNYKISGVSQTLSTITIDPSSVEIGIGFNRTFTATARDINNIVIEDLEFNWTSENESVGTINQDGVFTAVATGGTTIKATYGSIFGTAQITVREPAAELSPVSIASTTTPDIIHTSEVTVAGRNTGELDAGSFNVTLFENDIEIANKSVGSVTAGEAFSTVFNWKPSVAGTVNLIAVLDSGGAVTEIDEFNNNISIEYNVLAPDLQFAERFSLTDSEYNALLHASDQEYYIKISNYGSGADSGWFNISVWNSWTNETQIISVNSIGNSDIQEMKITLNFTPDAIGTFNTTVIIDPENNVPEVNEGNNEHTESFTIIKNGYAGHRANGEEDIQTLRVWDINGSVTMSVGDSGYSTLSSTKNMSVTWDQDDLAIPENATVVEARLMLPYCWGGFSPANVNMIFNDIEVPCDGFYSDRKNWLPYNDPWGQLVYNVTDAFIWNGTNDALAKSSSSGFPRGMILMAVYEDKSLPRRQMFYAEGFDLLIGGDRYHASSENAIAYATFTGPNINLEEMTSATLIGMATGPGGLGPAPGNPTANEVIFNNKTWKNGWGDCLRPSEIAITTKTVTDYVKVNGNEAAGRDLGDGTEPMNFILIASYGEVENEKTYVKAADTDPFEGEEDPVWAGTDRGRLSYKDDTPTGEIKTSEEGKTLADFSVPSGDGKVSANIPKGTVTLDKDGAPVDQIEIESINPEDIDNSYDEGAFTFAGAAYECSPSGATFSPAIDLVFTFTADEWKQFDGMTPSVMYYNTKTKEWEEVETTYDPDTMTVTATVSHFSKYAVFAKTSEIAVTSAATGKPVHLEAPEVARDSPESGSEGSSPASNAILGLFVVGFVGICSFGAYKFKLNHPEKEFFRGK